MVTDEMVRRQSEEKQRLVTQFNQINAFMQNINSEYNAKGIKLTQLIYVINNVLLTEPDKTKVSMRKIVYHSGWTSNAIRQEMLLLSQGRAFPLVAENTALNVATVPIFFQWLKSGAHFRETEGV